MATLLCQTYPALRIYDPASGEFHAFIQGRLDIEEGDPGYEAVMAEAARNPSIVVVTGVGTCPWCGESFVGKAAKLNLGKHEKDVHYDKWLAAKDEEDASVRMVEIKSRTGFPCDVCQPTQSFGSEDDLTVHTLAFHASAPALDAEGNDLEGGTSKKGRRRPGEVEAIPAAVASDG